MRPEKIALLFGDVPEWADPDDPEDRAALCAEVVDADGHPLGPVGAALREVVVSQVADERPPEVWAAAQRMLAQGLDREEVLDQLTTAVAAAVSDGLTSGTEYDEAAYLERLARLPLPSPKAVATAMIEIAEASQPIAAEELDARVAERLGMDLDDDVHRDLLDRVDDLLMDDGPLAILAHDRVVHVPSLTRGIVLTHRLDAGELASGAIDVSFDLSGFVRRQDLRLADGSQITAFTAESGALAWTGPDGWLDGFSPGGLVAVAVDDEGIVDLAALRAAPVAEPDLVDALREVYDGEEEEIGLPVGGEDLILALLVEDRSVFDSPRAPLAELCAAAGLERRDDVVAHDEAVWQAQAEMRRARRLSDRLDDPEQFRAAARACRAAFEGEADRAVLAGVLSDLRDPRLLSVVTDEILGTDDDAEALDVADRFAQALLGAASTSRQRAVAHWLAAVVAERRTEPEVAEQHLHLAVEADSSWPPAVDRLAWYASDRGDAATAVRLWRRLGVGPDRNQDLAEVLAYADAGTPRLGRNEPCWCGSGRKFKQCHLGQPRAVPLPDRVGWLCRKSVAYLERRGGGLIEHIAAMGAVRAVDPDEASLVDALGDPLVADVVLHEQGWFHRFLAERGPLLPEDEQLLAGAWALVDRTVYEVEEVRAGEGVSVRDLRTGDRFDVRERTMSRHVEPGRLVCGRAVPDGVTQQFIGGLFPVAPGTEGRVLDLLDEGDAEELLAHVADLHRPPALKTREGEDLVACEATVHVPDPDPARRFLDATYEAEGDEWVEMYELDEGDAILRATLRLDGPVLTVTTMSEPRVDRVLAAVAAGLPGARVIDDRRRPVGPGDPLPPAPVRGASLDPAMARDIQDHLEQRWMSEPVPALGGLTPREAAADPTRRQELERLLATFPAPEPGGGWLGLRPERLRRELGLGSD